MRKWDPPSVASDSVRRADVVSCWMCGACMHPSQMLPDGGIFCDDVRWFCVDARACTERWTTSRRTLAQTSARKSDGTVDAETHAAGQPDRDGAVSSDASVTA